MRMRVGIEPASMVGGRGTRSVDARLGRDGLELVLVERVHVHGAVADVHLVDAGLVRVVVAERVLHPLAVQAVLEVLARVRAAALLALLRAAHRDGGVDEQVLQLQRLHQVGVPHHARVLQLDLVQLGQRLVDEAHALSQALLRAEHRRVVLHHLLHLAPHRGGGLAAGGAAVAQRVDALDARGARAGGQLRVRRAGLGELLHALAHRAAKDDDVKQRVGAQPVGAVHAGAGRLAGGEEAGDHGVGVAGRRAEHLAVVVGGDAAHVVVHGGDHGDRLLRHVHARKDGGRLTDAGQPLREQLRRQVVQVQVDVVLLGAHAAPLANLHRHGAGHHVARRQVLCRGRVALHEALALGVAQDAALAARALRDEAARAVDAGGVELHKLEVLQRQPRARSHTAAVAGAGVRAGGAEVRAAVAAGGEDGVVRAEAVQRAVLLAQRHHAAACAVLVHDQVQRKVLHKKVGVVLHGGTVEGVQHGVAGAIRGTCATVRLPAAAVVEALAAKGALIDLAVVGAREGQAVVL
mmetsp:Transcript_36508/g.92269  ORF Transcript_36508/g.92269 Transcript_36508/m.92269 type:complete len:522 (-) Transcript_36508:522-2087(-)